MQILSVRSRCRNRAVVERVDERDFLDLPAQDDARLGQSGFTTKLFYPERDLFSHTNRDASGTNTVFTGDQSRSVNANPALFKTSPRSFCVTMAATVSRGSEMPVGVWLVTSEPKDSKSYEACLNKIEVQSDGNSDLGLLSANEPN